MIWACRRSPETCTSVTTAEATRGSDISYPMSSLSSSRIASETRSARRASILPVPAFSSLQPFERRAYQHRPQQSRRLAFHQLQYLLGASMIGRHGDGGDRRSLPQILDLGFGDRHVELTAQTVFEALDGVALVFERVRVVQPQLERQDANARHRSGRFRPSPP